MARDNDSERENASNKPVSRGSRFVRRLIPTVAAASLSFTACIPGNGDNNGDGNNGNNDPIDAGDITQMDSSGGDDTGGEEDTSSDDTSSDDTGPTDTTAEDTAASDTGSDDTFVADTGSDSGPGDAGDTSVGDTTDTGADVIDDIVGTNGDGMVSTLELQNLCEAWKQCDPDYFSTTYGTVSDCLQQVEDYLEYYLSYYEQYGGPDCATAFEAFLECQLSSMQCVNGEIYYDYSTGCYQNYDYSTACNN